MKKILFGILMTVTLCASAATDNLEKKWSAVITAIAQVESEGRADKVSRCGRYVGYLQISKVLVRECNNIAGYEKYSFNDRLNKQKSIDMFIDYQERFNPEGNMEKAIRMWNSGDPNCMRRKRPTEGYYRRVMSMYTAKN